MKHALFAALALPLALLASVAAAPATWLDEGVRRSTRGMLGLAGAEGTLWRGSGVLQAILPSGEVETLESIRWTLDPRALLAARVRLLAHSRRDGKPVLDASFSPGGVTVAQLRLEVPAVLLGMLSTTLREADLSGRIALRAAGLRVDGRTNGGAGDIIWRDAGSSLTRIHPLGDYHIAVQGAGRGLTFTLSTRSGPLALAGNGQWQPGAPLKFEGRATPAADHARQLVPLLRIIGKDDGGSGYRIVLDNVAGLAGR